MARFLHWTVITPDGPHTHLLPDLLSHHRPFAANTPIPPGWLPVLNAYPANPARDSLGNPRPFDRADHDAFQHLLTDFGIAEITAAKRRMLDAVENADGPDGSIFETRFQRIAARVALRQIAFTDGPSDALAAWQRALEPVRGSGDPDAA